MGSGELRQTMEPKIGPAEFLRSELLTRAGFRHAFFTRRGGVSEGPFSTLNFSVGVGDVESCVEENLRRAASVLGVAPEHIYFLSQVHGRQSATVEPNATRASFCTREGDIVSSAVPESACAVRSADCVPILLGDRRTGVTAAVHAGWRGVAGGAVAAGIAELQRLGASVSDLVAAIGPHISQPAFEVSEDVAEQLDAASPEPDVVDRSGARPHVNLRRIVRAQLRFAGLGADCIDDVAGCTSSDSERFFSFRRDGKLSGRHLSSIVPKR